MTMEAIVELIVLLVVANGSPLVARAIGGRWLLAHPIDGGRYLRDGQPLLGPSKTWRGLVVSVVATGAAAQWLEVGLVFGLCFGLLAMLGDLFSSFIKRRLHLDASARFRGLDQFPEAVLPLMLAKPVYGIGWGWVIGLALAFTLINILTSPILFRLGLRRRPH